MDNVSGNLNQNIQHDFGPFIKITGMAGEFNIRKELILSYSMLANLSTTNPEEPVAHCLVIHYMHGISQINIKFKTEAELRIAFERIEWEMRKREAE